MFLKNRTKSLKDDDWSGTVKLNGIYQKHATYIMQIGVLAYLSNFYKKVI